MEQLPSVAAAGMGLATTNATKKRMIARTEVVARANIASDVGDEGEVRMKLCQLLYKLFGLRNISSILPSFYTRQ